MPKKAAPKDARKRTKKPGKIADLPAKSLKGKDAAAVKGGLFNPTNGLKIDGIKLEQQLGNVQTDFLKLNR